ncbi:dihydrofolate reductase family protein [Gordonia sp. CPCC 205515]|uniref:dihydrofolate reductase family protein n=1 Tax=Gordonia sp. CPCC 205515 TaxID=3140791 RepID=UPI003AF35954
MRRLVLKMSMSLDGFVAGPNGEMDWSQRARSKDSGAWVLDTLQSADVHLMGAGFYTETRSYWSKASGPMAAAMNDTPKVVATHSAKPAASGGDGTWKSPYIADGNLDVDVQRLKDGPGEVILVNGGVRLARSLVRLGLVDEYRLVIAPIALGTGRSIFSDLAAPLDLALVDTTVFSGGIVAQTLVPKHTKPRT